MSAKSEVRIINQILYISCIIGISLGVSLPAQKNISSYLDATKYKLVYELDFNKDAFIATANIDFIVKVPEKIGTSLILDSEGLDVQSASLKDSSAVQGLTFTKTEHNITLNLQKQLRSGGSYSLALLFSGKIQGDHGIIKYETGDRKYISAYLYPYYARKAFPCFNDVYMKSVFSLTISTGGQQGLLALSNTPLDHINDEKTLFQFKDTAKMPIYSLFFTVGHYEVSQQANYTYLPSYSIAINNEYDYVLENTEFKILMKNSKLDKVKIVCVPGLPAVSFTGYGIVALRQDNIYVDFIKETTEQRKQSLLNIFAAVYKLFYGNMLTPKSWSDSWLVESFAIYLKYNGLSEIQAWGDPNDYLNYDIQENVLISNAHPNSRAVVDNTLKTEQDVLDFIKGPSMLKGAGILRMLERVLSKEILLDVIMDYFSDAIGTGKDTMSTDDFVNYLASDNEVVARLNRQLDMRDVMRTWLYQPGYPYLQTQRSGGGITIRENVFVSKMPAAQKIIPWKFPVFYTTEKNPDFDNDRNYFWLLSNDNRSVALNFTAPQSDWIIVNVNGSGLYRVNYEDRDWINLAFAVNEDAKIFPASTRAKLVSDAFAMLYAGHTNFSIVTSFLSYLRKEDSLTPWLTALDSLQYLNSLLYNTDLKEELDTYVVTLLADIYKTVGVEGNSVDSAQSTLRQKVVGTICKHGYAACLTDTAAVFKKMNDEAYRVDNDVRPVVICNGIKQYNKDKWMQVFNETFDDMSTLGQIDKKVYFEAMACNQNQDVIVQFHNLLFKEQTIPKDDVPIAFKAIFTNPEHTAKALNYFVIEEQDFRKDIGLEDKVNMMNSIAPYLTTDDDFTLLQDFLKHVTPPKALQDATMEAMKNINYTKNFLKTNHDELKKAFKIIDGPTTPTPIPTTSNPSSETTSPSGPTNSTGTGTGLPTPTPTPKAASSVSIFSLLSLLLFILALRLIQ